jgi:hypothetical protein
MASLPLISARQESESHAFLLKEATGPGADGIHERESVVSRCGAAILDRYSSSVVSTYASKQSTEELLPTNVLHCNGSSIRNFPARFAMTTSK